MTKFTIDITDPVELKGLTAARNNFNSSLAPELDQDSNPKPINTHKDYIATDELYIQYVMSSACKSYARQYSITDEQITDLETKLAQAKQIRGI